MRTWKTLAAAATAVLLLVACNGEEAAMDESPEVEESSVEGSDVEGSDVEGSDVEGSEAEADEDDAGADDADDAAAGAGAGADDEGSTGTSDLNETMALREVDAATAGSDDAELLFADLPEGIEFDVPVEHTVSVRGEPEDGEWLVEGQRQSGFVLLNLPGSDIAEITSFVEDQAAEQGWEETQFEGLYVQEIPLPDDAVDSDGDGQWYAETELQITANDGDPPYLDVRVTISPMLR